MGYVGVGGQCLISVMNCREGFLKEAVLKIWDDRERQGEAWPGRQGGRCYV